MSGTDTKGDRWTLTLYGPGTMNVVDQNGNAFTKETRNTPDGHQHDHGLGDGDVAEPAGRQGDLGSHGLRRARVFFQQLTIANTGAYGQLDPNLVRPRVTTPQNGIAAVDMPNFWLGHTDTAAPTQNSNFHSVAGTFGSTPFKLAGGINAPEGINTLRFGGVDTTFTPPGGTPLNSTKQNNEFVVNLGPPIAGGTSIIVNKVITDASSLHRHGTTTTVYQQSVTFLVNGRINLFQANEIDGNTSQPGYDAPTQFATPDRRRPTSLLAGRHLPRLRRGRWRVDRADRRHPDRRQRHELHRHGARERRFHIPSASTRRPAPRSATSSSAARPTT